MSNRKELAKRLGRSSQGVRKKLRGHDLLKKKDMGSCVTCQVKGGAEHCTQRQPQAEDPQARGNSVRLKNPDKGLKALDKVVPDLSLRSEPWPPPVQDRTGRPRSLSDPYPAQEICASHTSHTSAHSPAGPRRSASLSLGPERHPAPALSPWDKLSPTGSPLGCRGWE